MLSLSHKRLQRAGFGAFISVIGFSVAGLSGVGTAAHAASDSPAPSTPGFSFEMLGGLLDKYLNDPEARQELQKQGEALAEGLSRQLEPHVERFSENGSAFVDNLEKNLLPQLENGLRDGWEQTWKNLPDDWKEAVPRDFENMPGRLDEFLKKQPFFSENFDFDNFNFEEFKLDDLTKRFGIDPEALPKGEDSIAEAEKLLDRLFERYGVGRSKEPPLLGFDREGETYGL